jgi:hypothetical protein
MYAAEISGRTTLELAVQASSFDTSSREARCWGQMRWRRCSPSARTSCASRGFTVLRDTIGHTSAALLVSLGPAEVRTENCRGHIDVTAGLVV